MEYIEGAVLFVILPFCVALVAGLVILDDRSGPIIYLGALGLAVLYVGWVLGLRGPPDDWVSWKGVGIVVMTFLVFLCTLFFSEQEETYR